MRCQNYLYLLAFAKKFLLNARAPGKPVLFLSWFHFNITSGQLLFASQTKRVLVTVRVLCNLFSQTEVNGCSAT
jgi:hypothetical protein